MNIGVALPEWVFAQDRRTAPLVLLGLVFAGLALPILAIALYLHRAQGKIGVNQVCHVNLTFHVNLKYHSRTTHAYDTVPYPALALGKLSCNLADCVLFAGKWMLTVFFWSCR